MSIEGKGSVHPAPRFLSSLLSYCSQLSPNVPYWCRRLASQEMTERSVLNQCARAAGSSAVQEGRRASQRQSKEIAICVVSKNLTKCGVIAITMRHLQVGRPARPEENLCKESDGKSNAYDDSRDLHNQLHAQIIRIARATQACSRTQNTLHTSRLTLICPTALYET